MSRKNDIIIQLGTAGDKIIVGGIWKMFESNGLPLDIIFSLCIEKNWIPCWITLYNEMLASGMKHDRIISKLEEALCDSFGKQFSDVVIFRLNNSLISHRKNND